MSISWRIARLKRMSPKEVFWRLRQTLLATKDSFAFRKNATSEKANEIRATLPPLSQPMTISYFAIQRPWKGEDIPWQDPAAMKFMPSTHWSNINYRDTERYGDPKIVWELNRQQYLRYWIQDSTTDLSTKVNAVSHLILHWIEKNPVDYGINWCSSLEVALRLISWEAAVITLGDENFDLRVMRAIHRSTVEHAAHLRRFPSLHSSANNHRLGELVGEMAAAALFPDEDLLTYAWKAWHQIQAEAYLQVSPDGVSREQAIYYHAYVMLYLQRAAIYAEQLAFPVPIEFRTLLVKMQTFLDAATGKDGQWFEIGDRDDGDLKALKSWSAFNQPISTPSPNGFFPYHKGGYAIWKNGDAHTLFRCGKFGYPSIAAHSHADQLSVLLKVNGYDLLTDSGTGNYHDSPMWRRYFRGTSAHNTILIDSTNQATYGGPFLWNTAPEGQMLINTAEALVTGSVSYLTNAGQVTHTRTVYPPTSAKLLVVSDSAYQNVPNTEPSQFELIWNFAPDCSVHQIDPEIRDPKSKAFRIENPNLPLILLEIKTSVSSEAIIYKGDENKPAGFYSRQFGERIAISQLRIRCQAQSLSVTSTFTSEPQI